MPDEKEQIILEVVNGWIRQARADLAVALMVENEKITPEILAFHSQQAVEKSLKALLVMRQVEFPRTHVIGVLLNLCRENGLPVGEIPQEIVTLTQYAVKTRYPGESDPVSREEAQQAARLAYLVFIWAESQVNIQI